MSRIPPGQPNWFPEGSEPDEAVLRALLQGTGDMGEPGPDCPAPDVLILLAETLGHEPLPDSVRKALPHIVSCNWCRAEADALLTAFAVPLPATAGGVLEELAVRFHTSSLEAGEMLRQRITQLFGQAQTAVPAFSSAVSPRTAPSGALASLDLPGWGVARVTRDARGLLLHLETDRSEVRDAIAVLWLTSDEEDDTGRPGIDTGEILGFAAIRSTGIGPWSAGILPITPRDAERLESGTAVIGCAPAPLQEMESFWVGIVQDYAALGTRADPLSRAVWQTWLAGLPPHPVAREDNPD